MIVQNARMKKSKLLTDTIRLMETTNESAVSICKAVNISTRWYQKIKSGQCSDPGVNKIERLYTYLSSKQRNGAA